MCYSTVYKKYIFCGDQHNACVHKCSRLALNIPFKIHMKKLLSAILENNNQLLIKTLLHIYAITCAVIFSYGKITAKKKTLR